MAAAPSRAGPAPGTRGQLPIASDNDEGENWAESQAGSAAARRVTRTLLEREPSEKDRKFF